MSTATAEREPSILELQIDINVSKACIFVRRSLLNTVSPGLKRIAEQHVAYDRIFNRLRYREAICYHSQEIEESIAVTPGVFESYESLIAQLQDNLDVYKKYADTEAVVETQQTLNNAINHYTALVAAQERYVERWRGFPTTLPPAPWWRRLLPFTLH